jgi:hypothetical protein
MRSSCVVSIVVLDCESSCFIDGCDVWHHGGVPSARFNSDISFALLGDSVCSLEQYQAVVAQD